MLVEKFHSARLAAFDCRQGGRAREPSLLSASCIGPSARRGRGPQDDEHHRTRARGLWPFVLVERRGQECPRHTSILGAVLFGMEFDALRGGCFPLFVAALRRFAPLTAGGGCLYLGCGAGGGQQVPRPPAAGFGMTWSLGPRQQDQGSVETKVNVKGSGRGRPLHTSTAP